MSKYYIATITERDGEREYDHPVTFRVSEDIHNTPEINIIEHFNFLGMGYDSESDTYTWGEEWQEAWYSNVRQITQAEYDVLSKYIHTLEDVTKG